MRFYPIRLPTSRQLRASRPALLTIILYHKKILLSIPKLRRMTSKFFLREGGDLCPLGLFDCQAHPIGTRDFSFCGVGEFVARALGINHLKLF